MTDKSAQGSIQNPQHLCCAAGLIELYGVLPFQIFFRQKRTLRRSNQILKIQWDIFFLKRLFFRQNASQKNKEYKL